MKNRRILVTGATGGIGEAIAERLYADGASVIITGRNEAKLAETAERLGERCTWISCDLSRVDSAAAMMDAVIADGGFDTLINCAGVLSPKDRSGDFLSYTEEEFDAVFAVNVKGVYFLCQRAIRYMIEKEIHGNILNIASEMGFRAATGAYHLSKGVVVQLTRGLGRSFAPNGIVVNGIAPGPVNTPMIGITEDTPAFHGEIPNRRYASPKEIAALASFMVRSEGRNLVGEVVISDGGDHLH